MKQCGYCKEYFPKLWKAKTKHNEAACMYCWNKVKHKQIPNKKPKKKKQINPISNKMAKRLAKYRIERDKFLNENPVCMYPGCNSRNVELHHAAGRTGKLLFDPKYFKALCRTHHSYVEQNPEHAKQLNLSTSRLDK